uniref:Annexin n=1 Tax=Plectus sambesii TaxID=2011161 RepID=A0A914XM43_9BILA
MAAFLRQAMLDPSLKQDTHSYNDEMNGRRVEEVPQEIGEAPILNALDSGVHQQAAEMDDNLSTKSVKSLSLSESIHEDPKEDATRIHELLEQRIHKPPVVAEGKRRPSMDKDFRNIEGTAIAAILCARTNKERIEIARIFMILYGKDLLDTIRHVFTGELGELLQALLDTPARYDARQLHRAITSTNVLTGLSTKDSTLIEILCTRDKHEIQNIRREYRRLFGSYLEHDLSKVTWSHLMHLFMWLVVGARDDSAQVDEKMAFEDAHALWRGTEGVGFDATLYNVVLSSQSFPQLRAVFAEYKKYSEIDALLAVDDEFSGDHKVALKTIIMNVNGDLPIFFARRLHGAMHGLVRHDTTLTRILVTRSEIDLNQIKQMYERLYCKSLEADITSHCVSSYRDGLLALVRAH